MSVAIRTAVRIQDQDDAPTLGAGQDGYALTWNNATGAFVPTSLFTGGLLATGATTGATSQAQAFTNGIIGPSWKPSADSTTALQLQNAAGTSVLNVDTTNGNVGIGTSAPGAKLHIAYAGNPSFWIANTNMTAHGFTSIGFNPEITGAIVGSWVGGNAGGGGFQLNGFSNGAAVIPIVVQGHVFDISTSVPAIAFDAWKSNGTTGRAALAAAELAAQWRNGGAVLMSLVGNGSLGIGTTAPATSLDIDAGALTMKEMTAPTGVANKAMLYTKDNGSGKTQLCVKLGDDVEIVLATQA